MSESAANLAYGRPIVLEDGPFKGWTTWGGGADPYETLLGPFCYRVEADGSAISAFQPDQRHLNGAGALHGGCLMSFADFSLFSIAHTQLSEGVNSVTLTMNSEFIAAGDCDGWVIARGEVLRETRSVVFIRGLLTQRDKPLLSFSGTLKKITPR
ncbi:MAG: PaaI family thioesterase [Alphaproteobacteria bacterium]|nr:PaaI family thioesterase [Alphaproteobacteria bacterium]